jgi:four helix bundle protein
LAEGVRVLTGARSDANGGVIHESGARSNSVEDVQNGQEGTLTEFAVHEGGGPGVKRAPARSFEDLIVWQKAHAWVLAAYRFSEHFPQKEMYALTSQLRRAAVSMPANIAEGFKKTGVADKRRFMNIAQGSLEECRYYMILARDLGYGDVSQLLPQLEEVSRILDAYARAIETPGS